MYNVTSLGVRVTIVEVEKQKYILRVLLSSMSLSSVRYRNTD